MEVDQPYLKVIKHELKDLSRKNYIFMLSSKYTVFGIFFLKQKVKKKKNAFLSFLLI
jgi:hypothetical protein